MRTESTRAGVVKRRRWENTGNLPGLAGVEPEPDPPPAVPPAGADPPGPVFRAPIKFYRRKREGFLDPKTARLVRSCARVRGYCIHALSRGADWFLWNKHAFVKKSGLQMHYVEEVMRTLRKTTTEFEITEIRRNRSPRLKVVWRGRGRPLTENEIRKRLIGYIRGSLRLSFGRPVKVDQHFLNHFLATTQLPREVVLAVAEDLKFIPGCELRQRGVGGNFKFLISLQDSSRLHGSPSERRCRNTVAPAAPGDQTRFSNAVPAIGRAKGPANSCPPNASDTALPSPPALRVPRGNPSGAPSRPVKPHGAPPADALAKQLRRVGQQGTLADPIQIQDRWVSGRKILRLACWMALEPMRAIHLGAPEVAWRFAHARNFAARALRAGHRKERVLEAYASGVRASNDDALDANERGKIAALQKSDEAVRTGALAGSAREPSAAVAIAWRILLADARDAGQRWAEIVAGERAPRLPRAPLTAAQLRRTAAPKTARLAAGRDREKFRELKSLHDVFTAAANAGSGAAGLGAGPGAPVTAAELLAHLKKRDVTLAQFNQLPWAAKKRTLQVVMAKRTAQADGTK